MAWVPIERALFDNHKTIDLSDRLGIPEVYVVGHLAAIWTWAMDNAKDGVIRGSSRILAKVARWPGDADAFVEAVYGAGFLDRAPDGTFSLHDWQDYGGKLLEKQRKDAERKRISSPSLQTRHGYPME